MANEISPKFFQVFLPNFKDPSSRDSAFNAMKDTLAKIQKHAAERVKMNAPNIQDEESGVRLRDTLSVDVNVTDDGGLSFGFSSTYPNVLRIHEEEYKAKKNETVSATEEGHVGNKFFTRVIDHWAPTWLDWFQKGIDEQIQKGNKSEASKVELRY